MEAWGREDMYPLSPAKRSAVLSSLFRQCSLLLLALGVGSDVTWAGPMSQYWSATRIPKIGMLDIVKVGVRLFGLDLLRLLVFSCCTRPRGWEILA